MKGARATWHTWNDETGEEIAVPVVIEDTFYEPGDPIPGYNLRHLQTGERISGICSSRVSVEPKVVAARKGGPVFTPFNEYEVKL